MIVDGDFTFRAPRHSVWKLLQDPDVLVKAMPGAQRLVATGDGTYEGTIRIGVGPVTAAQWTLSVALHDREEPARYQMKVDSKGPLGFTRGSASVELIEEPAATRMRYHADLQIGGKVAGIGQRLLDSVARMLTKQGLEALSREIELRLGASAFGVSAAIGVSVGRTVVDGEIVPEPAADDAAVENPESGEPPASSTAFSGDGSSATHASSVTADTATDLSADASADAHPVEPLAEVAAADAPVPPGMADAPAPVADLDQDLPPGTIG